VLQTTFVPLMIVQVEQFDIAKVQFKTQAELETE
jgi:hypothetical protein